MKSILDPTFVYVPSHKTNIRDTFKRVRREMGQIVPADCEPVDFSGVPIPHNTKQAVEDCN